MSTWLLDTPLFNMFATPKAKPLLEWCEANKPSLFISAESLTEISPAIDKMSGNRCQRANAQRTWLNEITKRFADRIHPVDAAIATRAGWILPRLTHAQQRHRSMMPSLSRGAEPRPRTHNTPRRDLWALDANADRDSVVGHGRSRWWSESHLRVVPK